jgi:phosphatidate phosphatase PAH1
MRIIRLAGDEQWIGVDLDGTLAKYDGYKGADHIGEPVSKMLARVKRWVAEGKKVKVFTARAAGKDKAVAIKAIKKWCKEHVGKELEVTCQKDRHMTALWDDRAVRVKKNDGKRIASGQEE